MPLLESEGDALALLAAESLEGAPDQSAAEVAIKAERRLIVGESPDEE